MLHQCRLHVDISRLITFEFYFHVSFFLKIISDYLFTSIFWLYEKDIMIELCRFLRCFSLIREGWCRVFLLYFENGCFMCRYILFSKINNHNRYVHITIKTALEYQCVSRTLWVGRGNLGILLKTLCCHYDISVSHFAPNSKGIAWLALLQHQNEEIKILFFLFPRVGIKPITCRVDSHTLVLLHHDWSHLSYITLLILTYSFFVPLCIASNILYNLLRSLRIAAGVTNI